MKNLFNNISQEEKQRILEMHKGAKMVFGEQAVINTKQPPSEQVKQAIFLQDKNGNDIMIHDGKNWVMGPTEKDLITTVMKRNLRFKIDDPEKGPTPEQLQKFEPILRNWAGKQDLDAEKIKPNENLDDQSQTPKPSTDIRKIILAPAPSNTTTTPSAGT